LGLLVRLLLVVPLRAEAGPLAVLSPPVPPALVVFLHLALILEFQFVVALASLAGFLAVCLGLQCRLVGYHQEVCSGL
jgi:hypothetical protein